MLLNLSGDQVETLNRLCRMEKVGHAERVALLKRIKNQQDDAAEGSGYIEKAKLAWERLTCQIDDEPLVSHGEGGAWVTAWVWVPQGDKQDG